MVNSIGKDGYGKGSVYRPYDPKTWYINYSAIYNPPHCEECGKLMRQWMVGHDVFYCKNKECKLFLEKFERK